MPKINVRKDDQVKHQMTVFALNLERDSTT